LSAVLVSYFRLEKEALNSQRFYPLECGTGELLDGEVGEPRRTPVSIRLSAVLVSYTKTNHFAFTKAGFYPLECGTGELRQ